MLEAVSCVSNILKCLRNLKLRHCLFIRLSSHARCSFDSRPIEKIIEKFGCRASAGDEETIARASTADVEQVALGVVDILKVGIGGDTRLR